MRRQPSRGASGSARGEIGAESIASFDRAPIARLRFVATCAEDPVRILAPVASRRHGRWGNSHRVRIRSSAGSQSWTEARRNAWRRTPPARRSIRPATPTVPGTLPSGVGPAGVLRHRRGGASGGARVAVRRGRVRAALGFPPGVGVPSRRQKSRHGVPAVRRARNRAEKTIQVVVGRAKVEFCQRPRRVYMPDE